MSKTVWETLSRIDVSGHTEDKNGFTYLSWAWAWSTLKDNYPEATFEKHMNPETMLPFFRDDETGTAFVRVSVTAGGETQTETFPVLDYKNKAVVNPNAMDINTALQRGMTKAISYLGLGAYIYAGEDLPPAPNELPIVGPDGVEKQAKGVQMIKEVFTQFIPLHDSIEALEAFWKNNPQAIMILKDQAPNDYADILAKFKSRKAELKPKPEKESA